MAQEHSNYRELIAVWNVLQAFKSQLEGKVVQVLSDNITTVAYLNQLGGLDRKFNVVIEVLWAFCHRNNIKVRA